MSPWPAVHFTTPDGLIILEFLINNDLTGAFFVASFSFLSMFLVSFFLSQVRSKLRVLQVGMGKSKN